LRNIRAFLSDDEDVTSSEDINNSEYERISHGDVDLSETSTLGGTEANTTLNVDMEEGGDNPQIDQVRHDVHLSDMEVLRHNLMLFNLAPPFVSTASEVLLGGAPQTTATITTEESQVDLSSEPDFERPEPMEIGQEDRDEEEDEHPIDDIGRFALDRDKNCYLVVPLLDGRQEIVEGRTARLYHEELSRVASGVHVWRLKSFERPANLAPKLKYLVYDVILDCNWPKWVHEYLSSPVEKGEGGPAPR
jgi:hypothetical protein